MESNDNNSGKAIAHNRRIPGLKPQHKGNKTENKIIAEMRNDLCTHCKAF